MAAGLGFIEFTTGDILTAASANGYLASQTVMVFASAAARTSAIASPQEGMMSYLKDTNATEYYSGSAWVALGGSSGALTYVGGGPFTASSIMSVNNVFSSTYQNYMVTINVTNSSASNIYFRMRASGADNTTTNYKSYASFDDLNSTAAGVSKVFGGSAMLAPDMVETTLAMTFANPQLSAKTYLSSEDFVFTYTSSGAYKAQFAGTFDGTTSFDGFSFYPAAGTMTGNVRVYGISNS